MNSLYKNYIKNSLILLGSVALFSVFLNFMDIINERVGNGWEPHLSDWSQWGGTVMMICFAAMVLHTFLHYKNVNKKTGIFVKQLPVKYRNDFLFKTASSVLFIVTSLLIMCAIGWIMYSPYFVEIKYADTSYSKEMWDTFYLTFTVMILLFSYGLVWQQIIGIPLLAIVMPFAAFLGTLGSFIGYECMPYAIRELAVFRIAINILDKFFEFICFYGKIHPEETIFLIWSIPFFILACILNSKIDYSNTGKLFLFRWCRPLAYIIGSTMFAFSMQIVINTFEVRSVTAVIITFILSWLAGFKIIQYFVRRFD